MKKTKVLITGGKGDIAQAVKRELETEGCYEVFAPGRDVLDVTSVDSIEKVIKQFVPDVLVNGAGYVVPQTIKNADLESIKRHVDINLTGTFLCTAIALKENPRLDIVNIASAAATTVHSTWSEYCATKAGVVMATRCWAEDGLYAISVSPGRTKSKMRESLFPDEDQTTLMLPEEFAKVVVKAIKKGFPNGSNIIVHKNDYKNYL